ncbi:hypothetical protein F5887DRAFT_1249664 [Amanita rubescens]|nr:hypothetical protein F5887DRAFT_1249664 [Amanita rubescens]
MATFKIASRLTTSILTKSFSTYPRALGAATPCQRNITRSNILSKLQTLPLGHDWAADPSSPQPAIPERTDGSDVDSIVESEDNGLMDRLLQVDRDELTKLLADISNEASITTAMIKAAKTELSSFSTTKWAKFAKTHDLPKNPSDLQLKHFSTPRYRLPLSLQVSMFENAWRWHDVYGEKIVHTREAPKVKILEPSLMQYIAPILALFQGRLIDKPEGPTINTEYSSGGEVEHEVGTFALFFVMEFGHLHDNVLAQVFLELLAAAEMNKSNIHSLSRIYGILTNFDQFNFYSYEPATNKFYFDETRVVNIERKLAFSDMMDVSNKIFGIVLTGYVDSLRAYIADSKSYSQNRDTHEDAALEFAESCCAKFREPIASLSDIEEKGNEGLALLTKRSTFTGGRDDPSTPAELRALATRIVGETHKRYLSED